MSGDDLEKQFRQALGPKSALETVRDFLRYAVADSDGDADLEREVRRMLVANPVRISRVVVALQELLDAPPATSQFFHDLVTIDGNANLPDATEGAARDWLFRLLRNMNGWSGTNVDQ